jgi:hypothetical protein
LGDLPAYLLYTQQSGQEGTRAMTPNSTGLGDAAVEAPSRRRRRRSILGKIGMVLSFVPWMIMVLFVFLKPG